MKKQKGSPNRLIHESSPYLLQHAYNPVDWYPWVPEALEKAGREDKPIIVSIGYSACHWCHVMERESFENGSIASYMNTHFVCIKVDREERPDIDQIYMDAVQAMAVQGGWPLNVFLTPGQKPFYGGTYYPPQSWMQLLKNVIKAFTGQRKELFESAEQITGIIGRSEVDKFRLAPKEETYETEKLAPSVKAMQENFDRIFGGMNKAPKFPMPSLWVYLLRYGYFTADKGLSDHVLFTLEKIARGGIYDQAGGGFARYSVDEGWFAPHFEKMLYDNGQLIGLFSEAYICSGNALFKEVVEETATFMERELMNDEGGFYSALDADSEGVEGKYYTWTSDEFKAVLGDESDFWIGFFGLEAQGNWENGSNILTRLESNKAIAKAFGISEKKAAEKLKIVKEKLYRHREKRIRPGLDDKILASWNGLALKGLAQAYEAFQDERLLSLAQKNAGYLIRFHVEGDRLFRTKAGHRNAITGYLDDYAFVIEGLISLYQVTFDEHLLEKAKELTDHTLTYFYDENEKLFYYTGADNDALITRKKEIFDNVIPASNSSMAANLYFLGLLYDEGRYLDIAEQMVSLMSGLLYKEPSYLSNWGLLYLMYARPFAEIAITGEDCQKVRKELSGYYQPNRLFCGTANRSGLPLLQNRGSKDKTTIYVCYNKSCKLPVHTAREAAAQMM